MNERLLDQVPKEHFTEIHRMAKLTGAEPSLHAPIQDLDLAGFGQQGWDPHEQQRKIKQLEGVMDKAHLLDPKGNTPIVVHAGTFPAMKWEKGGLKKIDPETGETIEAPDSRSEMMLINQQTGEVRPTRYKERHRIGKEEAEPWTPERQMKNMNWDQEKFQLLQWKKMMDEKQDRTDSVLRNMNFEGLKALEEDGQLSERDEANLNMATRELQENKNFKSETYQNMRSAVEDMYERFKKYPHEKGPMAERYKHYDETELPKFKEKFAKGEKLIENTEKQLDEVYKKANRATGKEKEKYEEKLSELSQKYNTAIFNQTEMAVRAVEDMPSPNTWMPVDDFAQEKTSESLAEAALYSYKKYGKNSPFVGLENVYPEFALSRAESLKKTIEEARKEFVEKATKKDGLNMSKKDAEAAAEKTIGVTWDVGHIYMLKKSGYTDEDIRKEAETIAPLVKHIHLTDNFGFEDSHLPPGMGDVNIKDQLRAIEEEHGKEGFKKFRGIVEAGEFVANYKEVPHLYALSDLNSPLYSENTGPTWDKAWDQFGSYAGGYGELLPQKYFDLYGAPGFSQLPAALGGSGTGGPDRGRFAATAGDDEE